MASLKKPSSVLPEPLRHFNLRTAQRGRDPSTLLLLGGASWLVTSPLQPQFLHLPPPRGVAEITSGKCSANPEVLDDVRGEHHPQRKICHNLASCTQTHHRPCQLRVYPRPPGSQLLGGPQRPPHRCLQSTPHPASTQAQTDMNQAQPSPERSV